VCARRDDQSAYQEEQHEHQGVERKPAQGQYDQLQGLAERACGLHVQFLPFEHFQNAIDTFPARCFGEFYAVSRE